MDREYVVMTTGQPRQWQGNDGTMMHAWPTMFVGEDMPADVHRPANVPGPQPNDKMFGSIGQMNKHGTRSFKRGQQQQASLNGDGGSGKREMTKADWEVKDRLSLEQTVTNTAGTVVAAMIAAGITTEGTAAVMKTFTDLAEAFSARALRQSRCGMGDPEPDFAEPRERQTPAVKAQAEVDRLEGKGYAPAPGVAVTVPVDEPLTTPFD